MKACDSRSYPRCYCYLQLLIEAASCYSGYASYAELMFGLKTFILPCEGSSRCFTVYWSVQAVVVAAAISLCLRRLGLALLHAWTLLWRFVLGVFHLS